jgi:hypothetical protein
LDSDNTCSGWLGGREAGREGELRCERFKKETKIKRQSFSESLIKISREIHATPVRSIAPRTPDGWIRAVELSGQGRGYGEIYEGIWPYPALGRGDIRLV